MPGRAGRGPLEQLVEFVLYSRPGCHLCDEMLESLADITEGHVVTIRTVDIDGDPDLKRRYGLRIPVLTLSGEEICSARLDADRIRLLLRLVD